LKRRSRSRHSSSTCPRRSRRSERPLRAQLSAFVLPVWQQKLAVTFVNVALLPAAQPVAQTAGGQLRQLSTQRCCAGSCPPPNLFLTYGYNFVQPLWLYSWKFHQGELRSRFRCYLGSNVGHSRSRQLAEV
jgi:hypothetical protein